MSKAILIIDMPESCGHCDLLFCDEYSDWCGVNARRCGVSKDVYDYRATGTKPDWCPLKPVPEKRDSRGTWAMNGYVDDEYSTGWNDCMDEVLGT